MTKRKPLKTKKTPRKPNPYNVIRRVVSKYCKEQGTKCGNDELNEIYREIKKQYLSNEKTKKNLSLKEIEKEIARVLGLKNRTNLPAEMHDFDWFNMDYEITRNNGLFFKPTDTMVFDMSADGLGTTRVPFSRLSMVWNTDMYPQIRGMLSDMGGIVKENSVIPRFVYNATKSNERKRIWVWNMIVDTKSKVPTFKPAPSLKVVKPKTSLIDKQIELENVKKENSLLREKALDRLQKNFDNGVYTKKEFKEMTNAIMKKYAKGGNI